MEHRRRRFGDRKDGIWLRDLDPMHQITPYIMPNRADNEAFISERIDLTQVNQFLEEKNQTEKEFKYTLFHVILAAILRCVVLRPKMNRFVQGRRMYQRNELSAAFVIKKHFSDESHEALAFIRFSETDGLEQIHERIKKEVTTFRSEKNVDNTTACMNILGKIPRFVLRFVMWTLHRLDFYGWVPNWLIKDDPDYATVFISNLGSIKLHAGYHHLNNWGTNSVFVTVGEKHLAPIFQADGTYEMHEVLELGITLDERIADGYYYSQTMKLLRHLLQNPAILDQPANEPVEFMTANR